MSLLSTDISKVKRLSLTDIKLPAPELRVEPITPTLVEGPPPGEAIVYSKLVALNPLIEDLVEGLKLVSCRIKEQLKKIDLKELEEKSYTKETLIKWISKEANINNLRAEKGFMYMLNEGTIQETIDPDLFYLTGSTPF